MIRSLSREMSNVKIISERVIRPPQYACPKSKQHLLPDRGSTPYKRFCFVEKPLSNPRFVSVWMDPELTDFFTFLLFFTFLILRNPQLTLPNYFLSEMILVIQLIPK